MLRHRHIHIHVHRTHDNAAFEAQHPRADDGRFGNKAGEHGAWSGSIDPELKLSANTRAAIEDTMHKLSARYPSLAGVRVRAGDWLEGSETLATKSKDAVILNASKWADEAFIAKYAKDWDGCLIDPSPGGVIAHECGHILDGQLLEKLGSRKYNNFLKKQGIDVQAIGNEQTTPYGMENSFEFMAESFAAYHAQHGAPGAHKDIAAAQLATANRLWTAIDKELKK